MIFRGQTSADPLVQGPRQTPDLQVTNIFTLKISGTRAPQMDILHKKKIFYTNDICAKLAKINYYPGKKVFIF